MIYTSSSDLRERSVLHIHYIHRYLSCTFQSHLKFKYICREQPMLLSPVDSAINKGPLLPLQIETVRPTSPVGHLGCHT